MSKRRMIYIMPVANAMVRSPRTMTVLPATGSWVPAENYWLRRIADGSVREATPPDVRSKADMAEAPKKKTSKEEGNKQ